MSSNDTEKLLVAFSMCGCGLFPIIDTVFSDDKFSFIAFTNRSFKFNSVVWEISTNFPVKSFWKISSSVNFHQNTRIAFALNNESTNKTKQIKYKILFTCREIVILGLWIVFSS